MHFLNLLLAALFVVSTARQSPTMTAAKLYLKQEEPLGGEGTASTYY